MYVSLSKLNQKIFYYTQQKWNKPLDIKLLWQYSRILSTFSRFHILTFHLQFATLSLKLMITSKKLFPTLTAKSFWVRIFSVPF